MGWTGGLPNALPALLVLIPPQNLILLTPAAEQICKLCNGTSGPQSCNQQVDGKMPLLDPALLGTTQRQSLPADRHIVSIYLLSRQVKMSYYIIVKVPTSISA